MRIIETFFVASAIVLYSCGTLKSTTYIEPNQSFVLGENKHNGYNSSVRNTGEVKVQIVLIDENGEKNNVGVLAKGEEQKLRVPANNTVQFSNKSEQMAEIKIKALGDTNLTMGYK